MRKTGTKEWAEHNLNIDIGCPNGCLYCYARERLTTLKMVLCKNTNRWAKWMRIG